LIKGKKLAQKITTGAVKPGGFSTPPPPTPQFQAKIYQIIILQIFPDPLQVSASGAHL